MTPKHLDNLSVGDAVEAAIGQDGADGFAIRTGSAFKRVDNSEGGLALAEVAGDGLAEDVFDGGEIEDIIDDLEGETKIAAVLAHLGFNRGLNRGFQLV